MFGEGISSVGDILDLAAENGIINKSGAWYAYDGNKIGQGRENAKQYLKDTRKSAMKWNGKSESYLIWTYQNLVRRKQRKKLPVKRQERVRKKNR